MDTNDFLAHYASKYYDPQKAHEYYMRTRELKGRQSRSTSALNAEGKQVWATTKEQITNEKKAESESIAKQRDQQIEAARQKAEATKASITAKLQELEAKLAKRAESKREAIEKKRAAELEQILAIEIPEGLSKEERAKRVAKRNEKIAKLYSESKADKASASKDANKELAGAKSDASNERSKVASELNSVISATREAYTKAKTSLDESYETIYQQEYDKILAEYGK